MIAQYSGTAIKHCDMKVGEMKTLDGSAFKIFDASAISASSGDAMLTNSLDLIKLSGNQNRKCTSNCVQKPIHPNRQLIEVGDKARHCLQQ